MPHLRILLQKCRQSKYPTARAPAVPEIPSGGLHDAAKIARVLPAAMLFVASRDGISHDPREYSQPDDMALAAEIVAQAISG